MTSTQLDESAGARPNDGTGAGMIAWLNWTIERSELPEATASALRTGCQKVLDVEGDASQIDMRTVDLDPIVARFRNRHRGSAMKDRTIDAYEQRFRQTTEMYRKWLDDDNSWRPATRKRSSSLATPAKKAEPKALQTERESTRTVTPPGPTGPKLIEYPFPIRPGLQGIISLPEDLTIREAKRISNFVASLAFEDEAPPRPPLAITNGRDSSD